MTIQEALDKAVEGGYHVGGTNGSATYYSGANSDYSAWTWKKSHSTFLVPMPDTFLDPAFWCALGCALGWNQAVRTVHTVDHGRPTRLTRAGQPWLSYWHCFIDHLAEGNTTASFFDRLPVPVSAHAL